MTVAVSAVRSRPVDVLDDFLAPLVLEVDVDVRRLVALARDEAFHEQLAARGIHLGDAEAVAHHGIRGRAAPLAEDVEPPRLAHDVVYGEEVGLVFQIGDERQLVVDLVLHDRRNTAGPAALRPGAGELAQVRGRRLAGGYQLARILVAQFVEREVGARGDADGFRQQPGRIEPREPRAFAQVALAVGEQPFARLGQRDPVTDRRQCILQLAAFAQVHVDVARGGEWQAERRPEPLAMRQAFAVEPVAE